MHRFLQKAASLIKKHNFDNWQEYHLCSIIVAGGNILSIGFNQSRTHGYIESIKTNKWTNMHAEIDSILKARKKIDLRGTKMFVARLMDNNTHFAMARPCSVCQVAIRSYGIKKVIYSIDDETYAVMKI